MSKGNYQEYDEIYKNQNYNIENQYNNQYQKNINNDYEKFFNSNINPYSLEAVDPNSYNIESNNIDNFVQNPNILSNQFPMKNYHFVNEAQTDLYNKQIIQSKSYF